MSEQTSIPSSSPESESQENFFKSVELAPRPPEYMQWKVFKDNDKGGGTVSSPGGGKFYSLEKGEQFIINKLGGADGNDYEAVIIGCEGQKRVLRQRIGETLKFALPKG